MAGCKHNENEIHVQTQKYLVRFQHFHSYIYVFPLLLCLCVLFPLPFRYILKRKFKNYKFNVFFGLCSPSISNIAERVVIKYIDYVKIFIKVQPPNAIV